MNEWRRTGWTWTASVDNFWLVTAMRHGIPAFLFLVAAIVINLRRIFANKALPESAVECRSAYLVMSTGLFFTLSTVHVWGGPSILVMALIGGGAWMAEGRDERTEVGSRARIRRPAAARDRGPNGSPNGGGAEPASPDDPVEAGPAPKDPAHATATFGHPHGAAQRTRPRSLIRSCPPPWSGASGGLGGGIETPAPHR